MDYDIILPYLYTVQDFTHYSVLTHVTVSYIFVFFCHFIKSFYLHYFHPELNTKLLINFTQPSPFPSFYCITVQVQEFTKKK